MNDYSDLIYLLGAIIMFSMLSMQATRMIQRSELVLQQAEIEYYAVALGQDYIDKVRWLKTNSELNNFAAGFPKTITQTLGSSDQYEMDYEIDVEIHDTTLPGSDVTMKRVTVSVTNEYLRANPFFDTSEPKEIKFEYIKSF